MQVLKRPHFIHSTREIPRATAMPMVREIIWTTVLLNVVFPPLFISASTPAIAMYINPPAVNPCQKGDKLLLKSILQSTSKFVMKHSLPQSKMTVQDLSPTAEPTPRNSGFLFHSTFTLGHNNNNDNEGKQIKKRESGTLKCM